LLCRCVFKGQEFGGGSADLNNSAIAFSSSLLSRSILTTICPTSSVNFVLDMAEKVVEVVQESSLSLQKSSMKLSQQNTLIILSAVS
jgi:hypothetical protein